MYEVLVELELTEGDKTLQGLQLMPIGKWRHRTGVIEITPERAASFAAQYKKRVAGQDLPILYIHSDKANVGNPLFGQAAGWITDVHADPSRGVLIDVKFTDDGAAAVLAEKYRYLSAEYFDKIQLPHHKAPETDVIMGAALVNRPHLKGMDPILNEETGHRFLVVEEKPDTPQGGDPLNSILRQLCEAAGIDLTDDQTELSEDQEKALAAHLKAEDDKAKGLVAEVDGLKTKLAAAEDEDERKQRNLAEAGFEEEALLLADYRADRTLRTLEEHLPKGSALSKVVKDDVMAYGKTLDDSHLMSALEGLVSGKGLVDLTEIGHQDAGDDHVVNNAEEAATEIITLTEKLVKDEELPYKEAQTRVARENPKLWNQSQSGGSRHAAVEVKS